MDDIREFLSGAVSKTIMQGRYGCMCRVQEKTLVRLVFVLKKIVIYAIRSMINP